MALELATSPAHRSDTGITSISTTSFTRPTGGLLVAMVAGYTLETFTVSGGNLNWTRRARATRYDTDYVEIWTAPVTGSGTMTVTLGGLDGEFAGGIGFIKVQAVTGQHPTQPIGASDSDTADVNNLNVTGYQSTAAGSRGFFVAMDSTGLGTPSVGLGDSGYTFHEEGEPIPLSGAAVVKAANTANAGTNVQFNLDAPGSSAAEWSWAALEILAGGQDAELDVETVAVVVALPIPAVGVGGERTAGGLDVAASLPVPAASAGASASPAPVTVSVLLPPPAVSTEPTELVSLSPLEVAADLPPPAVSGSAQATASPAAADVDMPTPEVTSDAHVHLDLISIGIDMPSPIVNVPVLPGDRISRAGQIEWNGFLLGSGTPYSWQEMTGWRNTPPIVSGNVDQPTAGGSYAGQPFPGERVINWGMLIKAARGQVGQAVNDLIAATGIAQDDQEGWLVIWDFDDDEPYLIRAHLTNRDIGPVNRNARLGILPGALQWTASDPRRLSVLRASATIPIGVEREIFNNGNDAATPEIRIYGPLVAPQVENMTSTRVIAFDLELEDEETLVIDTLNGNVTVNGADRLSTLIEGSVSVKDFVLGPGVNRLLFTAESGGVEMDVLWRHASN